MVLVRLLLFFGLAAILVSFAVFLIIKDRRYLRFIVKVLIFAAVFFLGVMVFYAFERLVLIV
ncbi:MAG: hypothetical protein LBB65_08530 [Burkholderiales bacterium]|jgi:hypothetical protein|nr:hypothetical protein [Burkholderiales bacterium]